jgi:hypothetical protein
VLRGVSDDEHECCFLAEYFTDTTVCDPVPDEMS